MAEFAISHQPNVIRGAEPAPSKLPDAETVFLLARAEVGLCVQIDPGALYPGISNGAREENTACSYCETSGDCLENALEADERFGIWGALGERASSKLTNKPRF